MEKKDYGFKFNPDGSSETILRDTSKGDSKVLIQNDGNELNMPETYVLANKPKTLTKSKVKDFVTGNPDVGKGSAGFVGVITLASIIAIAGAIIAFLTLRY